MNISKYILRSEYECPCCGELPTDFDVYPYEDFFDLFDNIREEWGKPIDINSGYRCPEHNAYVGGNPLSVHIFGLALDLDCEDDDEVDDLYSHIIGMYPSLRIGQYKGDNTFIHIDRGFEITPRASIKWHEGARW